MKELDHKASEHHKRSHGNTNLSQRTDVCTDGEWTYAKCWNCGWQSEYRKSGEKK